MMSEEDVRRDLEELERDGESLTRPLADPFDDTVESITQVMDMAAAVALRRVLGMPRRNYFGRDEAPPGSHNDRQEEDHV